MISKNKNANAIAGRSKKGDRHKTLLAKLLWLALAPMLTSCIGTPDFFVAGNPPSPPPAPTIPTAPQQQDAWLSFKFTNGVPGCGAYVVETCGLQDDSEATAYYNALGIANPLTYTLADWFTKNFPGVPCGPIYCLFPKVAHGIYFNKLDLQFGRDMYCWQNGQTVACYVVNYGPPPGPNWPNRAQALDDASNHTHPPFATVAMVYDPANSANQVSFYVFDNAGASDPLDPTKVFLSTHATLDEEGPKTVPRMCMGCHGGLYSHSDPNATPPAPASVTGAQFLPFDVVSFGLDASPPEQQAFLDLNAFVLATKPNPAIVDFVNGTYKDLGGVGAPFTQNAANTKIYDFIPDGWNTNTKNAAALYATNFRTYCRMCHLAQAQDLATLEKFTLAAGQIEDYVCVKGDMPHMEVPFGPQNNLNLRQAGAGLWADADPQARKDLHDFLVSVNGQTTCPPH